MKNSGVKDLTTGTPAKLIIKFFFPLLLGMLFQQFYNMMDTMIVGRTLGAKALAAVGGTGSINFLVIGFCMGVCSGFAIPVATCFGAKDEENLRRYVANSVWLAALFSIVMTVSVCILCRPILVWMQTPKDTMEAAHSYIFVIFMGIPVIYLYNLLAGILRSLGDSKTPLYFLVMSSLLNIILDLVTILGLNMGVKGAAYATIISQGVSGILCLIYISKKYPILKISRAEWRMSLSHMKGLCMMGVPMGLQYSITAIGSVILQTAVNGLGSMAVASITTGGKVTMFFCCPFDAFGSTMATYAGQNTGAGKLERITAGIRACGFMAIGYAVLAAGILIGFGEELVCLFIEGKEVEVIQNAALMMKWASLFLIPLAYVNIMRFTIQGMGYSHLAILAGVCEMLARAVVGFVFVPRYGYIAACLAAPIAWILADIFLVPAYFWVLHHMKSTQKI